MTELTSLSKDERKQVLDRLKKDPEYVRERNFLLLSMLLCGIVLAAIGLAVKFGLIPEIPTMIAVVLCVIAYIYIITRFSRARRNMLARLMMPTPTRREEKEQRRTEKKEAKKARKKRPNQ